MLHGSDDNTLTPGARYILANCWLKSYQLGALDLSGNATNHTVIAQLQPDEIELSTDFSEESMKNAFINQAIARAITAAHR
jgi:hypothetical protein